MRHVICPIKFGDRFGELLRGYTYVYIEVGKIGNILSFLEVCSHNFFFLILVLSSAMPNLIHTVKNIINTNNFQSYILRKRFF